MNRILLIIGAIVAGIALFVGGVLFCQANAQSLQPGWMMGNWNGSSQTGYGMMGNWTGQAGPGMGIMMNGGMGGFGGLTNADPLTIEEAEAAVSDYLATLNNDNLELGEIMIFDNHAYAQIIDGTTESGTLEVLVDPVTGNVFPEPGPNMMWNTEYGMMTGFGSGMMGNGYGDMMDGRYGGMMGGYGEAPESEISVTAQEAVEFAQEYLDAYLPGKTADDHADAFPGYYTLHVLEDGEIVGMLSVNAYTGQVFPHHWHGEFIEMTAENHE